MIIGISGFVFLSKSGRFVTYNCFFPKMPCCNPYFYSVFFGCALSGPSCQRREFLDTPPKIKNILTDNWKALSWVFMCFYFLFLCFFFFLLFFLVLFFCFFKDQVRWPEGPPHLAPKPSSFLFCFVLFVFVFCFFVLFGGFKGQVRWPEGPPHLALNPHYFFCFFFGVFSFLCF